MIDKLIALLQTIDPFLFAYGSGLLILMFFALERLDAPLRSARGRNGSGDRDLFAEFIDNLPPSSLRVPRYVFVAWVIYVCGLAVLFTILCFVVALAVKSITPEQAGLNNLLTITPGTEATQFGNTLADAAGQYFPVSKIAPEHPWQPVLIALGMSGVLPILPRIRQTEQRIRRLSLRAAGFPSQVFKLYESLHQTGLDFDRTMAEIDGTGVYQDADHYFQMLAGATEQKNREFRGALAIIAGFRAWTADPERFPDDDVRRIFDPAAPRNLETDVAFLMDDIAYQVRLSDALVEQGNHRRANRDSPGMAEAPVQFIRASAAARPDADRNQNIARARETLGNRWGALADKAISESKVCCLLIALYAERAPRISGSEQKTELLRWWVTQARAKMSVGSASFNYFMFSMLTAVALSGALLYSGLYHAMVELALGVPFTEVSNGRPFSGDDAAELVRTNGIGAVFLFLPAALPLFMFRDVWVRESRWKFWVGFFDPPLMQYVLFFVSGMAISAIFQMMYLYLEPMIVPGSQRGLSQINEFITLDAMRTAALRALSSAMLAAVIASALDQRFRKDRWYWLNWGIIVAFCAVAFPMTLRLIPIYAAGLAGAGESAGDTVSLAAKFDTYVIIAMLTGVAVAALMLMILYVWQQVKRDRRAAARIKARNRTAAVAAT